LRGRADPRSVARYPWAPHPRAPIRGPPSNEWLCRSQIRCPRSLGPEGVGPTPGSPSEGVLVQYSEFVARDPWATNPCATIRGLPTNDWLWRSKIRSPRSAGPRSGGHNPRVPNECVVVQTSNERRTPNGGSRRKRRCLHHPRRRARYLKKIPLGHPLEMNGSEWQLPRSCVGAHRTLERERMGPRRPRVGKFL
jgi:hypothetical protein